MTKLSKYATYGLSKFKNKDVGYICEEYIANPDASVAYLCEKYGVSRWVISNVITAYFGNGTPIEVNISEDKYEKL